MKRDGDHQFDKRFDVTETKRIAILSLSALGDLLNALPLIANCRGLYPSAQIVLICARNGTTELARTLGVADSVVQIAPNARRSPIALWRSLRRVRSVMADVAFQSFSSHGSFGNLILGATRARVRCGFESGRFRNHLTHRVPVVQDKHYISLNLDLLRRLGHLDVQEPTERYLPEIERNSQRYCNGAAENLFGRYVVISIGSDPSLAFKRWPAHKWAELCRLLSADGIKPVFIGDSPEREQVAKVLAEAEVDGINLAGQTSFQDLAAVISSSLVVIGTDGMTLHLASAMKKRCVGVFGPTDPVWGGPLGQLPDVIRLEMPCSPCYTAFTVGRQIVCTTHECLHFLPVHRVFEQASKSWRPVSNESRL